MPTEALHVREQDLAGKVAVVAGGSRGIGRATALHLASRGCSVLATCSNTSSLHHIDTISNSVKAIYKDASKTPVPKIVGIDANVTDSDDSVQKIVSTLKSHFDSKIDILVNNVAVIHGAPPGAHDAKLFTEELNGNIHMPFMLVDELVKEKLFQLNSRIINISSVSTKFASPLHSSMSSYITVKSALEGMARAWAQCLGDNPDLPFMKGTTANSVLVGPTNSELYNKLPAEAKAAILGSIVSAQSLGSSTKYVASTEDVADVVGMLCGRDARWITGSVVSACGGAVQIS